MTLQWKKWGKLRKRHCCEKMPVKMNKKILKLSDKKN